MIVAGHEVKFERNTRTGQWRAMCAGCGWCRVGDREEVQTLAATHDIEWQPADPAQVDDLVAESDLAPGLYAPSGVRVKSTAELEGDE